MSAKFPCARCGRPVERVPASGTKPKRIGCPRCGFLIYDYPRPCCGTIVLKSESVLLLRRAHPPRVGALDIPGGFLEAGETLEGSARRELREETGLAIGALEPLGTYWDTYFLKGFGRFPTLNFYFIGRWRRGTPVAADDAASAEWVPMTGLRRLERLYAWKHMADVLAAARRWAARRAG